MKLIDIYEAKTTKAAGLALTKMVSYLERKLGTTLIKIPGVEHFHNSNNHGYGIRFVFSDSTRCIRFNWSSESGAGQTASIHNIDIFTGKSHDPNFTIDAKGISLVKTLPMLVQILQDPTIGRQTIFPVTPSEALSESLILEAKRDDFTAEEALTNFLKQLSSGKAFTRSEFIGTYHIVHAGVFDTIYNDFKDKFSIENRRLGLAPGTKIEALKDSILAKAGVIEVSKGGSDETYLKNKQEEEVEKDEKIPYADTLEHLEGLVQGLIKGSFNSLFVAGPGGTGKTQTVEKVLADNGLSDGNGYFKNTGSASPAGMYTLLYHHRNDIILFDDCDSALDAQEGRNLIKAATDTKKSRKLVWGKKSSFIFDPDEEDEEYYEDDMNMAPKFFDFKGRIIFISNMPLAKLDPDGALRSRSFIINVNPTEAELFDHMGKILYDIKLEDGLSLSKKERDEVLEVVKSSTRKGDVSLRKLVRGLNLAASGSSNWRVLVKLYA